MGAGPVIIAHSGTLADASIPARVKATQAYVTRRRTQKRAAQITLSSH